MISVENALQTVLNTTQDFGVEEIPFLTSLGRILKEDILADRDFPPFHRVSMDGIVIDGSVPPMAIGAPPTLLITIAAKAPAAWAFATFITNEQFPL